MRIYIYIYTNTIPLTRMSSKRIASSVGSLSLTLSEEIKHYWKTQFNTLKFFSPETLELETFIEDITSDNHQTISDALKRLKTQMEKGTEDYNNSMAHEKAKKIYSKMSKIESEIYKKHRWVDTDDDTGEDSKGRGVLMKMNEFCDLYNEYKTYDFDNLSLKWPFPETFKNYLESTHNEVIENTKEQKTDTVASAGVLPTFVGAAIGATSGASVGVPVVKSVGPAVGATIGASVGVPVVKSVGPAVGATIGVDEVAEWVKTVVPGETGQGYADGLREGLVDGNCMDTFPLSGTELTEYGVKKLHCRPILANWAKRNTAVGSQIQKQKNENERKKQKWLAVMREYEHATYLHNRRKRTFLHALWLYCTQYEWLYTLKDGTYPAHKYVPALYFYKHGLKHVQEFTHNFAHPRFSDLLDMFKHTPCRLKKTTTPRCLEV